MTIEYDIPLSDEINYQFSACIYENFLECYIPNQVTATCEYIQTSEISNTLISSSSSSSSVVPSSTVTPTLPTDNPLPTEVIAVFGVAIILFIIVLILMLLMGICCLCKRKPSSSTLRVQSIENPDYTGAISTSGSVKKSEDFSMSLRNGGTPQSVPAVQPVPPPLHDMDDYDEPEVSDGVSTNRYSQLANVGTHTQSKLDTQRGTSSWVDTRKSASEVSPSLAQTEATYTNGKHGYSVPRPAGGSLHGKPRTLSESSYNKHHYSSPPPETAPPPPPPTLDPYYSVLEEGSDQHFISTINDIYDDPDDMNVPSTRDPEIVDNYDVVILDMHKKVKLLLLFPLSPFLLPLSSLSLSLSPPSPLFLLSLSLPFSLFIIIFLQAIDKDNPQIYSYVPTQVSSFGNYYQSIVKLNAN
jgi:hypothetical protein